MWNVVHVIVAGVAMVTGIRAVAYWSKSASGAFPKSLTARAI